MSTINTKAVKDWYWHQGEGNRPREDEFFVHLARYATDQKAALLARLREPEMWESVKTAMRERDFAREG